MNFNDGGNNGRTDNDEYAETFMAGNSLPQLERIISQRLNSLSTKQREEAQYELHGIVMNRPQETTDFVTGRLHILNQGLTVYMMDGLRHSNKCLYAVLHHSPGYVRDTKFLLMFLRSCKWDVCHAMTKIEYFFEQKGRLFGTDASTLGRDVTIKQDFTTDDIELLSSGYAQVLPGHDRSGRGLLCFFHNLRPATSANKDQQLRTVVRTFFLYLPSGDSLSPI